MSSDADSDDGYNTTLGLKYWCSKSQQIIPDIKRRESSFDLSALCGTYHWVWNGHPESADCEEIVPGGSETWGCITLQRKSAGKPATPANIRGSFQLCMLNGSFQGLQLHKDEETKRIIPSSWRIKRVEWVNEEGAEEGLRLSVSETLDDNGYPFLIFWVIEDEGCHGHAYDMVAKRQRSDIDVDDDNSWEGLSEDEKDRLGIELSDKAVKRMAMEDSEDNTSGSDESGVSTDEDKPVQKKRKSSWPDENKKPTKEKRK